MREALIQAIRAAFEDDEPRLVWADWLAENGEPERGEYVQLSVREARRDPADAARLDLAKRRLALEKKHGRAWSAPLRAHAMVARFERGLIEEARVKPKAFVDHADAILAAAPFLRSLWSRDPFPRRLVPAFAARPELAAIERLGLHEQRLGEPGVRALLASPHLTGLRSLGLRSNRLDRGAYDAIAAWPGVRRLTHLNLGGNPVVMGELDALIAAAEGLESLRLASVRARPAHVLAGVRAPGVTELDLSWNDVRPEDWPLLAETFPQVRRFTFDSTRLDPAHGAALARTAWPLTHIKLFQAGFDDATMRDFVAGDWAHLQSLRCDDSHFGPDAWQAIGDRPWPRLHTLFLSGPTDPRAVRGLHGLAPQLRELTLWGGVTDDTVRHLFSVRWDALHTVRFGHSKLTAASVAALEDRGRLPALRRLDLGGKGIGGADLRRLRKVYGYGLTRG